MIELKDAVFGVLFGTILIVFGLAPSLLQGFADGVRNFRDSVTSSSSPEVEIGSTSWLAPAGAALITLVLLAYFF